jgi:hypothetical protein
LSSRKSIHGTLDDLQNQSIIIRQNEKPVFKIEGEQKKGKIFISKMNMVPIIYRKKYIGDAILEIRLI